MRRIHRLQLILVVAGMLGVVGAFGAAGVFDVLGVAVSAQQTSAQQTNAQQADSAARPQPADSAASQPAVVFRAQVNYVELDATVTDDNGAPVKDLTADAFEVFEDGQPQKLINFSWVDIPIGRAERPLFAASPIEPDVQSNEHAIEGRIYLLLLDDLDTDFTRGPRTKAALRRFVEQKFGTNDLGAVVYTGSRGGNQDFTSNRSLLLAAIDRFTGQKLPSETAERLDRARALGKMETDRDGNVHELPVFAFKDPYAADRGNRARSIMQTVRRQAEFMAGVRGRRKALLLVGEGLDFPAFRTIGNATPADDSLVALRATEAANEANPAIAAVATEIRADLHDAIAAATRGNVTIYGLDPRGLSTGDEDLVSVASLRSDLRLDASTLREEIRTAQDTLRSIADGTGGFATVNQNDLTPAFDRIVAENSSYYVLGYNTPNSRREGRFRKLDVRLKRPGLHLRTRDGYYEARGSKPTDAPADEGANTVGSAALSATLGSPLAVSNLPFRVFVAPRRGDAPYATVAITAEFDASKMNFVDDDDTMREELKVVYLATNNTGQAFFVKGPPRKIEMDGFAYDDALIDGLYVRSQAEMNLKPGHYQLRVAAENAAGRTGSLVTDIDVPDYFAPGLSMSGVSLMSAAEETMLEAADTINPADPSGDFLTTGSRVFGSGDTIVLKGEVYQGGGDTSQRYTVDIRAELKADGGRSVRTVTETRSAADFQPGSLVIPFKPRLSLEDIEPGTYVLHVDARSRDGSGEASRDIQIEIRKR